MEKAISSFLGHAIAGYSVARLSKGSRNPLWILWLVFAAMAPDIDYILAWFFGIHFPIRYTHSIGFCFGLSVVTVVILKLGGVKGLKIYFLQTLMASLSHLMLDSLVGVYQSPWFWPISSKICTFPFGILPSAGKLSFDNEILYRNLLIEMGILIPVLLILRLILSREKERVWQVLPFLSILLPFVIWSISLKR
jgi:hypothetical protein